MFTQSLLRAITSPSTHPYLREALAAAAAEDVTLRGACDPRTKVGGGFIPGHASIRPDVETMWEFVSVEQCGLSVEQLVEVFDRDEELTSLPFKHWALKGVESDILGMHQDFYDSLNVEVEAFSPLQGVDCNGARSRYCLVMRDKQSRVAGLVSFEVELSAGERDIVCDDPAFEAATLKLTVRVQDLYVLTAFRAVGAASAGCEAIAHVIREEARHLAQQLEGATRAVGQPFKLEVLLDTEMYSQAAQIIDRKLLQLIRGDLEPMFEAEEAQGKPVLQVLAVASDSSW